MNGTITPIRLGDAHHLRTPALYAESISKHITMFVQVYRLGGRPFAIFSTCKCRSSIQRHPTPMVNVRQFPRSQPRKVSYTA